MQSTLALPEDLNKILKSFYKVNSECWIERYTINNLIKCALEKSSLVSVRFTFYFSCKDAYYKAVGKMATEYSTRYEGYGNYKVNGFHFGFRIGQRIVACDFDNVDYNPRTGQFLYLGDVAEHSTLVAFSYGFYKWLDDMNLEGVSQESINEYEQTYKLLGFAIDVREENKTSKVNFQNGRLTLIHDKTVTSHQIELISNFIKIVIKN